VVVENSLYVWLVANGIIQEHSPTAGEHKYVADAEISYKILDIKCLRTDSVR